MKLHLGLADSTVADQVAEKAKTALPTVLKSKGFGEVAVSTPMKALLWPTLRPSRSPHGLGYCGSEEVLARNGDDLLQVQK